MGREGAHIPGGALITGGAKQQGKIRQLSGGVLSEPAYGFLSRTGGVGGVGDDRRHVDGRNGGVQSRRGGAAAAAAVEQRFGEREWRRRE